MERQLQRSGAASPERLSTRQAHLSPGGRGKRLDPEGRSSGDATGDEDLAGEWSRRTRAAAGSRRHSPRARR